MSRRNYKKLLLINYVPDENKDVESGFYPSLPIFAIYSFLMEKIKKGENLIKEIIMVDGDVKKEREQEKIIEREIYGEEKIFAFYLTLVNYSKVKKLAKKIKEENKDHLIVYGGPYVLNVRKAIEATDRYVDVIVMGDGETPFYNILKNYYQGDGLYVRKREGFYLKGKRINFENLEKLPSPYKYIPKGIIEEYFQLQKEYVKYELNYLDTYFYKATCPNRCRYCSLVDKKSRKRLPQDAIKELLRLETYFQGKSVYIVSSNIDIEWLKRLHYQMIKENVKFKIKLHTLASVDLITEENIRLLKSIGFEKLFVGFESNDKDVLKRNKIFRNGKFVTPKMNERAFELIKKYDMGLQGSFILGLPGETKNSLYNTLSFIEELLKYEKTDLIISSIYIPIAGTFNWHKIVKESKEFREKYVVTSTGKIVPPTYSYRDLIEDYNKWCSEVSVDMETLKKILKEIKKYSEKVNDRVKLEDWSKFFKKGGVK